MSHNIPLTKSHLKYLVSLKRKKARESESRFFIEGSRLCREAIDSSAHIEEIITSPELLSPADYLVWQGKAESLNLKHVIATAKDFLSLCDTKTPQGIGAVVQKIPAGELKLQETTEELLLGLDEISDPGNLGTILRTAVWFGLGTVLLSKGCVDPYNSKVVRSSMGALFHLRLVRDTLWQESLPSLKKAGYRILAAFGYGGVPLQQVGKTGRDFVLFGGEARGISPSAEPYCDVKVTVPPSGRGESLNVAVAAGIILNYLTNEQSPEK
ncbi:hypothetical protein A2V82_15485 [candidate division KSB1 bacterium RBG_16_48_16]|nr:MAG: hypothetical protein A2V82_15485 [candidate division KSB1 bacterium RBG_16_48_16]